MAIFTVDKFRAKDVSARADYFEKGEELEVGPQRVSGEEDYFLNSHDTILSEIAGTGSVALGLGINPQAGDYAMLFNGFNPRTGESFVSDVRRGQLDKDPKANAGFSTSFNLDKSISLLYASAPTEVQQHFERAAMEASRRVIESAERRGVIGTRALNDSDLEDATGGVISLNYLHFTNRNQEPHLHVHCEIPNLVVGEDGKWRTINARELYARQTEMAAMFDGNLYQALQRDCPEIAR
jgi:conjugative relaxase-like TrwC/TraI family protein